jgi:hypothetical protein
MISKQSTNLIAGLDIETLDLSPSAVVMDIGVVIYDLEKQVEVWATNLTPSISEQVIVGRTVSKDTVNFHVRNYHKTLDSLVAHTSSFRPTVASVFNSMEELLSPVSEIWINGLSFDPVVLRSLFTSRGIDRLPWNYRKEVDVRSFRTLFKKYGLSLGGGNGDDGGDDGDDGKHRAVHEAIADARWNLEIARSVHTTFRDVYTNLRGVHTSSGGAAQPTLSS